MLIPKYSFQFQLSVKALLSEKKHYNLLLILFIYLFLYKEVL